MLYFIIFTINNFLSYFQGIVTRKGWAQSAKLIQNTAQRPYISFRAIWLILDNLWATIYNSTCVCWFNICRAALTQQNLLAVDSLSCVRLIWRWINATFSIILSEAEICQLYSATWAIHENVARCYIPMHYFLIKVQISQSWTELRGYRPNLLLFYKLLFFLIRIYILKKRLSIDKLHDYVICLAFLKRVIKRHDVRMMHFF